MALSGANDELWPLARMTFPIRLDSQTPVEQLVGHEFHSWMLGLGFIPLVRRTIRVKAFEVGRFYECSTSWAMGNQCHERTAVGATDGSTVLADTLVTESRGRLRDTVLRVGTTMVFRRRHRRLRRHFAKDVGRDA